MTEYKDLEEEVQDLRESTNVLKNNLARANKERGELNRVVVVLREIIETALTSR